MPEKIKTNSELTQTELMKWYRGGRTFQDIMKALQTSQLADISAEELLARIESQSWEEIWHELGVAP